MELIKLEKIVKGENPIIRLTFKTESGFFSKSTQLIIKDVCKSGTYERTGFWYFMDDRSMCHFHDIINTFYKNEFDVYEIGRTEGYNLDSVYKKFFDEHKGPKIPEIIPDDRLLCKK